MNNEKSKEINTKIKDEVDNLQQIASDVVKEQTGPLLEQIKELDNENVAKEFYKATKTGIQIQEEWIQSLEEKISKLENKITENFENIKSLIPEKKQEKIPAPVNLTPSNFQEFSQNVQDLHYNSVVNAMFEDRFLDNQNIKNIAEKDPQKMIDFLIEIQLILSTAKQKNSKNTFQISRWQIPFNEIKKYLNENKVNKSDNLSYDDFLKFIGMLPSDTNELQEHEKTQNDTYLPGKKTEKRVGILKDQYENLQEFIENKIIQLDRQVKANKYLDNLKTNVNQLHESKDRLDLAISKTLARLKIAFNDLQNNTELSLELLCKEFVNISKSLKRLEKIDRLQEIVEKKEQKNIISEEYLSFYPEAVQPCSKKVFEKVEQAYSNITKDLVLSQDVNTNNQSIKEAEGQLKQLLENESINQFIQYHESVLNKQIPHPSVAIQEKLEQLKKQNVELEKKQNVELENSQNESNKKDEAVGNTQPVKNDFKNEDPEDNPNDVQQEEDINENLHTGTHKGQTYDLSRMADLISEFSYAKFQGTRQQKTEEDKRGRNTIFSEHSTRKGQIEALQKAASELKNLYVNEVADDKDIKAAEDKLLNLVTKTQSIANRWYNRQKSNLGTNLEEVLTLSNTKTNVKQRVENLGNGNQLMFKNKFKDLLGEDKDQPQNTCN